MEEKRVVFSAEVLNLFLSMDEIRKENNLKRINSVILLKALLEEKIVYFMNAYVLPLYKTHISKLLKIVMIS